MGTTEATRSARQPADSLFVFVGEALALDLVNTEVVIRGKPRDLLATPADLAVWWREAGRRHREPAEVEGAAAPPTGEALAAVQQLRSALRRLFGAFADRRRVDEADLRALNDALRAGYPLLELGPDGTPWALFGAHEGAIGALLLPIALSAFRLLTTGDRARLHRCGNERCVLLFYDTTKSATRRWCSAGCMNRARSAQRYRQRRDTPAPPSRPGHAGGIPAL